MSGASVGPSTREPLKVCIVTTAFPRWPNDSRGPFILETARALRDQGVQVRVVALHGPGSLRYEWLEGIEVIRVRYLWPDRLEVLQNEGGGLPAIWRKSRLARLAFAPLFAALIVAVMRHARDCDVIHAQWTISAMAAWLGQWVHRRPYVLTVHGSDIFLAPRLPLVGALTRQALSPSRRIIAVSGALATATAALGISARRIEVIPNGIAIERFIPGPELREPLILFVGSLIERKGLKYLLQALPLVLRRHPGHRLVIVGDGPQRATLERIVLELDLEGQVAFVGAQSQAQVIVWMQRAKLFVLPSLEEAFGVVLLEAMASGTPCVASNVGGIPEVMAPDAGRLVPPADPEALAAAIAAVLDDAPGWLDLSRRARAHAEERCSTWKQMAVRLVDVYQSAVRAHA